MIENNFESGLVIGILSLWLIMGSLLILKSYIEDKIHSNEREIKKYIRENYQRK